MYYHLYGTLEECTHNSCVIDCSGVGYKLTVSLITSEILTDKVGQNIKLFTHLAVREDGIELFGFENKQERECFNHLISVNGVGPKAAMSILSIMTPDNFAIAVCTEDTKAISKASGIGGKTAARIILELRDKLQIDESQRTIKSTPKTAMLPRTGNLKEAADALMVLGYDKASVTNALEGLDPKTEAGQLIRMALKKLAR